MQTLITILLFLLVLGVLVLIHELGHFIAAKRAGVDVEEFGFGFPPRIFGKKIRGTLYSLNWIPLGGFVKIKGVAGDDPDAGVRQDNTHSFAARSFTTKFGILFAGIGMNVLLSIILFAVVFTVGITMTRGGIQQGARISDEHVVIVSVLPGSPAEQASIQAGDRILTFHGEQIYSAEQLQTLAKQYTNKPVPVEIQRAADSISFSVTPQEMQYDNETFVGIGVGLEDVAHVSYPWYRSIWFGVKMTGWVVAQIFISLFDLVRNIFQSGTVSADLAGPVQIAVITGEVARLGIVNVLQFMALLSVNLAVFNLLPLPALDGGRIFFAVLEKIRHKPVNQRIEATVHSIGFLLLLLLALLVTIRDISHMT